MIRVNRRSKILIGIDEVGRGPLAGPVCVCALSLYRPLKIIERVGLKDSKRLSKKQRGEWCHKIMVWKNEGRLDFRVAKVSQTYVDKHGIQKSISTSVNNALMKLGQNPESSVVLMDGGLHAHPKWLLQKTIVKGDETEAVIALASIIAKVHRDKLMFNMSKKHPEYGFEFNCGYGTKNHISVIHKIGPCAAHRLSYLKNLKKA